jgi:hypothetical protein
MENARGKREKKGNKKEILNNHQRGGLSCPKGEVGKNRVFGQMYTVLYIYIYVCMYINMCVSILRREANLHI